MRTLRQFFWPMVVLLILAGFSLRLHGMAENVLDGDDAGPLVSSLR